MNNLIKNDSNGNENWRFVSFVIGLSLLGMMALTAVSPITAHASTSKLTAPQVSAIIGLLQAFGVEQKTIDIVYAQLAPSIPIFITQTPDTPASTEVAQQPVVQPPSCTLTATPVVWSQGTTHALFAWTITPGATASIKVADGSSANLVFGSNQPVSTSYQFAATSSPYVKSFLVYSGSIFQNTTFEMDVSLNGLISSCTATVFLN